MTKVDHVCEYVRPAAIADAGVVHLAAKVFLKAKRSKDGPKRGRLPEREVGAFLCSASRRSSGAEPSNREAFKLEPCHKCVLEAERFEIDLGNLWQNIPGKRVTLYTTSPEERDRPYVQRGDKPVGNYHGLEVYKVLVPEDMLEITHRWYKRDRYHVWPEAVWEALGDVGRAEIY